MSYQVIARKYRPQTFTNLTGQEHVSRTLEHALDQGRLHHAYLFSGVRGTGKTTTARIFAKGLNCAVGITSKPCLECVSCREIASGNSIDVLEIDAASNTGVDNVRDVIINSIAIAPARDRYKVFVIDEVHMLSTSAFNALLKTLEEPPPHVVFIMATTELHKLPDTILSRCQQFEFRQIQSEKIFQRLRVIATDEAVTVSDAALRDIARAAAGSMRDAQSAFDQVIAFSGAEVREEDVIAALGLVSTTLLDRVTEAIVGQDGATVLGLVDELASRGYDLRNFARELMAWLRHLLVVKSGITSPEVLGVADVELARLMELSERFSEEDLVRSFHLLASVEKEIKDSPYPRFALEVGLYKLIHTLRLRPLPEIIARLEALETQLNSAGGSFRSTVTERSVPAGAPDRAPAPALAPRPALRPQPVKRSPEAPVAPDEPPGFGDFNPFDETVPPEIDEPGPQKSYRASAAPARSEASEREQTVSSVGRGPEVESICAELDRLNRGLLLTALEEAQSIEYAEGRLIVTFGNESVFAARLRDSLSFFRELGQRLFGQPMRIEVRLNEAGAAAAADQAKQTDELLRQRALNNPTVRMFLEKFRGEVVDVTELPTKA